MCSYCDVTKNRFERMIQLEPWLKQCPDFPELSIESYNGKAYLAEFEGEDHLDISNIFFSSDQFLSDVRQEAGRVKKG